MGGEIEMRMSELIYSKTNKIIPLLSYLDIIVE